MQTVTAQVQGLAGRGDAVVRLPDGEVVFIDRGAPGDVVQVRLAGRRKGVRRGHVVKLVTAGPARVEPFCPVANECGGCAWQHVDVRVQRAEKRGLARRALGEFADTALWLGEPPDRAWRRRMRAHFRVGPRGLAGGFLRRASADLVDVGSCPVLVAPLQPLIDRVRDWLDGLVERAELVAVAGVQGVVAEIHARPLAGTSMPSVDSDVLQRLGVAGLALHFGTRNAAFGQPFVELPETLDGAATRCDAGGFCQAGSAANAGIRAGVVQMLEAIGPLGTCLELYAGSGNLTALLDGRVQRVTAVERDPAAAARAARILGPQAGRSTAFDVVAGDAERFVASAPHADLWLLDPGRPGALEVVRAAASSQPPHVIYVSCAFDTLARDLRVLTASGYSIVQAALVDTFVHTPHFEVLVRLSRSTAR